MIKVENLTKRYAGYTAIKDLSFEVARGEIVGFLGPNGAGKSTTMKILSCFLPATSGRATVAGFDVYSQALEVRNHLGYMPENVPLYTDLRVDEYLEHRAALKGLSGRKLRSRVGEVKELTSLNDVRGKIIGTLSKGYRQRVGLADALVGDPDLLILDEPTIGLDPNQIRQVRELIKNLGQRHTILISTHILPEVEMTCSRVIILHKGRIEASDTPQNLLGQLRAVSNIRLEADTGADGGIEQLQKVPGIKEVTLEAVPAAASTPASAMAAAPATVADPLPEEVSAKGNKNRDRTPSKETVAGLAAPVPAGDGPGNYRSFLLRVEPGADPRAELFRLAVERKWTLRELARRRATLEDVFVEITHAE